MAVVSAFLFIVHLSLALGLYSSSDDVIELTANSFDRVYTNDGVWFVEFYAPWCGHCQSLAPEWKRAASALKGVVNVAAVNVEDHQSLASQFSIKGFPTILMFVQNKRSTHLPYTGERQHSAIVKEALRQAKSLVESRIGGKFSGSDDSGSSDVIELTDDNFDQTVLKSDEPWLVEFFAPWCGHCKNLKPHWEKSATELKGIVKVGAVDATVSTRLAQKYGIQGYPSIKFFSAGSKNLDPVDYDGGRTSGDIIVWAKDKADSLLPVPEILEILSPEVFTDACTNHPICVISVLPTLYDCQSDCRNQYLELVKKEAEILKKQKWGWIWTEALKQSDMEQKFNIGGSGYPSMVALHGKKMKFASLRGSFSEAGVHDFLRSLLHGDVKMPLYSLSTLPTIEQVAAWNGQDAPPIEQEEELDLSDLDLKIEL